MENEHIVVRVKINVWKSLFFFFIKDIVYHIKRFLRLF